MESLTGYGNIPVASRPYWLRGARLRKSYVGFGDALSLAGNLEFLSGLRGKLESIALQFGRLPYLRSLIGEPDLVMAWDKIAEAVMPQDAFLLHTGWYKETIFVGPVRGARGELFFAKLFKNEGDARREIERARFIEPMTRGLFRTAPVLVESGSLIAYELIEHGNTCVSYAHIETAAVAMAKASYMRSSQSTTVRGFLDWCALEAGLVSAGSSLSLSSLADSSRRVQLADCHGDFTPWNVFADRNGNLCLIDYERAETSVPFSDMFHLCIQYSALRGVALPVDKLIETFAAKSSCSLQDVGLWLALYLGRQLQLDTEQWNDGKRHPQLSKLIKAKSALLKQTLKQLQAFN